MRACTGLSSHSWKHRILEQEVVERREEDVRVRLARREVGSHAVALLHEVEHTLEHRVDDIRRRDASGGTTVEAVGVELRDGLAEVEALELALMRPSAVSGSSQVCMAPSPVVPLVGNGRPRM